MPGRGDRSIAAQVRMVAAALVVSAVVFGAVAVAGCDAHSSPTQLDAPASGVGATTAPAASTAPPRSATTTLVSPTAAPITGEAALNSAFPSAAARIPDAIETVRRFFDGLNHETDTGDEGPAIATFTTKCTPCGSEVFNIKTLLDGGHKLRGGHTHILSVESAVATYSNVVSVVVISSEDASDQLDASGQIVHHFNAAPATRLDFELEVADSPPKIWQLSRVEP